MLRFGFILLVLSLFSVNSFAQLSQISGAVNDDTTGEPLIGASIYVAGTSIGASTDANGQFYFAIPKFNQTDIKVVVHFLGYINDTIAVNTLNENFEPLQVKLKVNAEYLKTVEVVGRFEGQQKALYQQKQAINIKNIVAEEQIELFPDANAAEALQRLPGVTLQRDQGDGRYVQLRGTPPELTNFNINGEQIPSPEGNVRFVGLDVIASDQIASIEITKALTPDMDADGIGGNVNIVTKTATDTVPKITGLIAGGYNDIVSATGYQAQFSYAMRYKKLGFHINGNYYNNNQGSHNMEFKFTKRPTQEDTTFQPVYTDIQLRDYQITRQRIGTSVSLDYEFNPRHKIYLKGITNQFTDNEERRRVRNKFGSGRIINDHTSKEASIERDIKTREKIQSINSVNAGGEHRFGLFHLDYMLTYAVAKEEIPDQFEMSFDSDELDMELDLSESNWPKIIYPNESDYNTATDYTGYQFNDLTQSSSITQDENLSLKLNFKIPYAFKNSNGEIKFGTRIRDKEKSRDKDATVFDNYYPIFLPGDRQIYLQEGPDLSLQTVAGDYSPTLLGRGYEMGLSPDPSKSKDFVEYYRQNFKIAEADTKNDSYAEDYTAEENIYAYYGMITHHFGKWMFLGGARYERTDVKYTGNEVVLYKGRFFESLETRTMEKTYEFLLPQFHLKYSLNSRTNLRAAVTYTYSRPNFEDILPYRQVEDIDEIKYGNSSLKFPIALNIDLMAETYVANNGMISAGLFAKRIDNFIFYYKRFVHLDSNFSSAGLTEVTIATNGDYADVAGAEVNFNYKLAFLPAFWKNFGIYSNYTYTYSNAKIAERVPVESLDEVFIYSGSDNGFISTTDNQEEIPLPGQAEHSMNFAVFYDSKKLYAKLSANYQSAFLSELGQDKSFDVYYDQSFRLDFSADYKFTENLRVFAQVLNLTNTPLKYYMGTSDLVKQQEYYSWSSRFGVRFNF